MALTAAETMSALSDFMKEVPVIEDEEKAREAKLFVDRGKLAIADLEDERKKQVEPLNQKVDEINGHYRGPRNLLKRVLDELESRLSSFIRKEEDKRLQAAIAAREAADSAERAAREAERIEQERLSEAAAGELGVNVAEVTAKADEAFNAFEKAQRLAAIADRETKVRIGGGFRRAIGLKTAETLIVTDAVKAVTIMGANETITEAILKSARVYRNLFGELPSGVTATSERKL
jgi:hypothetical protein